MGRNDAKDAQAGPTQESAKGDGVNQAVAPPPLDAGTTPAPPAVTGGTAVGTEYVVLVSTWESDHHTWREHSRHVASDEARARRLAITGDSQLLAQVQEGGEHAPQLVAVPARSWRPKQPRLKQREPVLEV